MIKIEMKCAEFDNFLMILRAKIEYCSRENRLYEMQFIDIEDKLSHS